MRQVAGQVHSIAMHEFEMIERYLAPLAGEGSFGLKDDAACLSVPVGKELVLTKDAMVAGVHFFAHDPADLIARKLLRVNLSDLTAKAAKPYGYMLALMLPRATNEAWIEAFAAGLAQDQQEYGLSLIGGDTTRTDGPLCMSLTALGLVEAGMMLRRSHARPGDYLYVTGTIGDAALWLHMQSNAEGMVEAPDMKALHQRYLVPQPRVAFGEKLAGIVNACMDISDGLVQDAGHLAAASSVSCVIEGAAVPLSIAAKKAISHSPQLLETVLTGGDDYELLLSVSPAKERELEALATQYGIAITRIGEVHEGRGVCVRDELGGTMSFSSTGWKHF